MIFIGEQAVLIEVKTNDSGNYFIGDQLFPVLSGEILAKIVNSANWNRALKYCVVSRDSSFDLLGYFMVRFQLYLTNNKIICLAKRGFEQQIINQQEFQNHFLQEIFTFRNRNRQEFPCKIFTLQQDCEAVQLLNLDFNRCWVNDSFSLTTKNKFRILFKYAPNFKIEWTKKHQLVYFFPIKFCQSVTILDTKTCFVYDLGSFNFNVQANLIFKAFNYELAAGFLLQAVKIVEKAALPKVLINWHLFNITNDINYLVLELKELTAQLTLSELSAHINQISHQLKTNFWPVVINNHQIQQLLTKNYATIPTTAQNLQTLFAKYTIIYT